MDELTEIVERMRTLDDRRDALAQRRDDTIRSILAAGGSVAAIRQTTGLSRERIYQIRDRRR